MTPSTVAITIKEPKQWFEQDSVWYFKRRAFKEFIETITNQSVTIKSALDGWRELPILSKKFKEMTVKEVVASPQLIQQLYDELRDTNKMKSPKKFKLPYNKTARELELKQNLKQLYDDIDESKAYSKVFEGHYDGDGVVFPYVIEAAIAPRKQWRGKYDPGELEFIGCVNDEPAIDSGEKYFSDGFYTWESKNEKDFYGKPKIITASSAREILHKCGFGDDIYKSRRRWPSVFIINLSTPVPGWLGSAGKTHINLRPYANDIAKVVSWLAYKMPTCHGMGFVQDYFPIGGGRDEDQNATEYLRRFLKKRRAAIEANPYLRITDRITQSGVWYRIRPEMVERGFEPPESWGQTRRTLQGSIEKVIEELWPNENLTREELGIIASSKGAVFYDGEQWPINGDSVDVLAEKGVAIIVIEKEGVADALAPYARKYGIALAHTGGRFTKAVKKLIERAKKAGSVVRTLTDYDAVGMDIAAATITPTIRIGIERDIINWLQNNGYPKLREEDVDEEYTPSGTTIEIKDEYLKTRRIELDSIQEKIGGEKLWEYIMYRLQLPEFNTGFNLTKVIEMPTTEEFRPQPVKDVLRRVDSYIAKVIELREKQILTELENAKELPEKRKKETEIEEELADKITDAERDDKGMQKIVTKFAELLQPGALPEPEDYRRLA